MYNPKELYSLVLQNHTIRVTHSLIICYELKCAKKMLPKPDGAKKNEQIQLAISQNA